MLRVGSAPLAIVMNRKKFESLSKAGQGLIRKYSGEWTAQQYVAIFEKENAEAIEQLKSDPNRTFVVPSQGDAARAQTAFKTVIDNWLASDSSHKALLEKAEAELANIRTGQ